MMHILFLIIHLVMLSKSFYGQDLSLYKNHSYIHAKDTMPYRLLLPDNYNPSKKYPLILFLHGAGERGNDNEKQLIHGAKLFLRSDVRKNHPAIVVFPQCSEKSYWSNVAIDRNRSAHQRFIFQKKGEPTIAMVLVQQLLKRIIADYGVQKEQVYVGGLSMGGMGTFEIVRRNPRLFAAAFPICGGAHPETARKLNKTAWWVFHGARDDVVPPVYSQIMVDALKKKKASVRFTLYPAANHNSWDPAFAEKDLLAWLFAQPIKGN